VKTIPRTTIVVPISEEKCAELAKATAGLVTVLATEGFSPIKMVVRNNPNLETTKPRPIRATHVLNHARKVL